MRIMADPRLIDSAGGSQSRHEEATVPLIALVSADSLGRGGGAEAGSKELRGEAARPLVPPIAPAGKLPGDSKGFGRASPFLRLRSADVAGDLSGLVEALDDADTSHLSQFSSAQGRPLMPESKLNFQVHGASGRRQIVITPPPAGRTGQTLPPHSRRRLLPGGGRCTLKN